MTLRVEISDRNEQLVFTLTGRIQAEQISDLKALLRSETPGHHLVVDLADVRLVDRDAVRFLAELEAQGARLRNCSAYVREWICREQIGMRSTEVKQGSGTEE
jgi:anti-anti-sigma regulatory factor